KLNEVDSAIAYYDRDLEVNPDNLLALNNCAYFMAEQGRDLDKAERMSAICVRQQPDNDTAIDTFAWILFKQRRYAEAKEQIDRALAIEADNPQADVLHHAGDIYYMNGDHKGALELWQRALQLDPSDKLLQKKVRHRTHFFE
ncbi:MAG: tetratricopeptide repeat protein, partial [Muribaculaceae bacterium]|nr:tetratricopeptide repeat protein [Muribaculaceae bacterium]